MREGGHQLWVARHRGLLKILRAVALKQHIKDKNTDYYNLQRKGFVGKKVSVRIVPWKVQYIYSTGFHKHLSAYGQINNINV